LFNFSHDISVDPLPPKTSKTVLISGNTNKAQFITGTGLAVGCNFFSPLQ